MAKESDLRQRIGALLREHGFFVQAVESAVSPGMPDTYYSFNAWVRGWIEFKHIKIIPKRMDTPIFRSLNHGLSTEQVAWIKQEVAHGGTCYLLTNYGRNYFILPSSMVDAFNDLTIATIEQFSIAKLDIPQVLKGTRKCTIN
jgi:hypothetical protein